MLMRLLIVPLLQELKTPPFCGSRNVHVRSDARTPLLITETHKMNFSNLTKCDGSWTFPTATSAPHRCSDSRICQFCHTGDVTNNPGQRACLLQCVPFSSASQRNQLPDRLVGRQRTFQWEFCLCPFRLTQTLHGEIWPASLGLPGCQAWIWVDMLCSAASILNLTGISIDRLIAISQPLKYRERMTGRRVLYIIAFVWAYAMLCSSLSFVKWNNRESIVVLYQCSIRAKEYITIAALTVFFCPLTILVICYGLVLKIAVGHAKKMQKDKNAIALNYHPDINSSDSVHDNANGLNVPLNGQDRGSSRRRSSAVVTLFTKINKAKKSSTLNVIKQLKATKTLAIVVGFFIMCWFPFFVIFLTSQYCDTCFRHIDKKLLDGLLIVFVYVLPVCNSAGNPIIYSCFNAEFRTAFVRVFNKILRRSDRHLNPYNDHTHTKFSAV